MEQGRQKKRWTDTVMQKLEDLGLTKEEAEDHEELRRTHVADPSPEGFIA